MAKNENRKFLFLPILVCEHDPNACAPDCSQLEVYYVSEGFFTKSKRARCRGLNQLLGVLPMQASWHSGVLRSSLCRDYASPGSGPESIAEVIERKG